MNFLSVQGEGEFAHQKNSPRGVGWLGLELTDTLAFDLTKIPFLKCLIGISCLMVEVLNDQNLLTESNLADWVLSYVQFCSGGHFSERAETAR